MLIRNTVNTFGLPLHDADRLALGAAGAEQALEFQARRAGYVSTPLISLPVLAAKLGVGSIHIKDEADRLGLGSFKALGGAYAVVRLAMEAASENIGRVINMSEWQSEAVAEAGASMTFTCATDGNHGRSVAQGAQLIGAACVVFVHAGVSHERSDAIARYGARIIGIDGTYDDAVAAASSAAEMNGWIVVSDTSWPGYERIPHLVMQGYTAMLSEAVDALPKPPTHVFVQAGVGGIAAAVAAFFQQVYGVNRPYLTVVEPSRAACLFESARAGKAVKIAPDQPTVMAMLECYEPSLVAWRILSRLAHAFMTVDDDEAVAVMRCLARPSGGDLAIVAGESGGVGLAGLVQVLADSSVRDALGLDANARVFLINTEGATDPALYARLVGNTSANVASRSLRRGDLDA